MMIIITDTVYSQQEEAALGGVNNLTVAITILKIASHRVPCSRIHKAQQNQSKIMNQHGTLVA